MADHEQPLPSLPSPEIVIVADGVVTPATKEDPR